MVEIGFQKRQGFAWPFNDEDQAKYAEFKDNQVSIWKCVTKGVRKQRSIDQLNLFMAAIRVVVANTEDQNWNTIAKAKLSLKSLLNYIDDSATVYDEKRKQVIFKYRSFGYSDLNHMEACNLFDRAFPLLAEVIGISEEELINAAKNREYPGGLI